MPYTIVVADDHPLFLAGVVSEIDTSSDMEVIGVAETGEDAVRKTLDLEPDVLVLDMQLPDIDGIEVAARIRDAGSAANILPLSGYSDPHFVLGLIQLGVDGYVLKNETISSIVEAIRTVAAGGVYVSSEAAMSAISARPHSIGISPAQEEVLRMVAKGMTNSEIADELNRSEYTVRNHVSALRDTTGTRSRAHLVAWAWERGIVAEG